MQKSIQLNTRISHALNQQIEQCCATNKLSKSDFIRSVLQQKCDEILTQTPPKNPPKSSDASNENSPNIPIEIGKIPQNIPCSKWAILIIFGVTIGTFLGNFIGSFVYG